MRLRTDIFVSALLRRVFGKGDFAAIEKRGDEEAGAVFIRQHFRDGLETLYGPAPQSFFDQEDSGDRLFEIRLARQEADLVRDALDRERNFDPDLWIVELEADDVDGIVPMVDERKNPL
jgi:hypothetical protein